MDEISTSDAREEFSDLVGRVSYGKERIVITRNGKPQVALVPIEDLEQLVAMKLDRGMAAVRRMQKAAAEAGLDKMTAEEIDAEIKAARAERKAKAGKK